eukprot:GHVO01063675.1.p1 GENE.GHVO01063675.1~~GHVO01063675.1.p1  ORF type:complete len:143 (+),score=9.72 GHVO01063675.1:150-578(+)
MYILLRHALLALPFNFAAALAAAFVTLTIIAVAATLAATFKWSDWIFCYTLLWPLITKTVSLADPTTLPEWVGNVEREALLYSFGSICFINGSLAIGATIRFAINTRNGPWFEPAMTGRDKQPSIDRIGYVPEDEVAFTVAV